MILKAYCVFDVKALNYHQPFFALNDAVALRMIGDVVSDLNTSLGRHPRDYVVFCVGEFDDGRGQVTPYLPLVHVVDCVALVPPTAAGPLFNSEEKGS